MSAAANLRARENAAADLAWLLRTARAYIARERPRVCADCSHLYTLPSLHSGARCMKCAINHAETERR